MPTPNNLTATTAKINNYAYAPGIATYGIQGGKGATGEPGNAIFMTTYNIITGEELDDFKQCILDRRLPVRDGTVIPRNYQNGDLFFDTEGNIFRMRDIDRLLSYPITSSNYKQYFLLVGKIKFTNSADRIFSYTTTGKISLNADYSGLDINNTAADINTELSTLSDNYALRILSDNTKSESGIVEVMQLKAFNSYNDMPELNIIYDSNTNSWHLQSDIPVIIDQETKINDSNIQTFAIDGYSPVITTETPITNFINICKQIRYKQSQQYLSFTNLSLLPASIQANTTIKYVMQDSPNHSFTKMADFVENIKIEQNYKVTQVSFINNIECFIKSNK